MTITAKFRSVCPNCSKTINPGDSVEWQQGQKAVHTACPGAEGSVPAASSPRDLTVERVGRRSYFRGNTMAVRGFLRARGASWDAEAKAWWVGSQDKALAIAEQARTAPAEAPPAKRITHCVGCGFELDAFAQRRGFRFCSQDCRTDEMLGGQSGYVNGVWHQGSDD